MTSDYVVTRPVRTVLVIGAGVSGSAAAYWLDRRGFDVTMIEKHVATDFHRGYLTDVKSAGAQVLRRMGLFSSLCETAVSIHTLRVGITRNRSVDIPLSSSRSQGHMVVRRGTVTRLVHDAAVSRPRVRVVRGTTVTRVEDQGDGVEVTFDDGGNARFDLVVGADGLHSRTRRQVFGEDDTALTRRGLYHIYINVTATEELKSYEATMSNEGELVTLAYPGGDRHMVLATTPEHPGEDIESLRSYVLKVLRAGGKVIRPFADAVAVSDDIYLSEFTQVRLDSWSRGRVVLAGDAAHCMDPRTGQGLNTALLGAYTLAGELHRAGGDHVAALRAYEDRLRPFTRLNQDFVALSALHSNGNGLRQTAKGLAEVASTVMGLRPRQVLAALRVRPLDYGL